VEQQNTGKFVVQLNQTTTLPVVAGSINYETPNDQENGNHPNDPISKQINWLICMLVEIRGTFIPRVTESSIRRFTSYFIRQ
jgi:hypothetical protein